MSLAGARRRCLTRHGTLPGVRALIVDPAAYTAPYDHALSAALARAGLDVELVTGPFAHGPVSRGEGYSTREHFYRLAGRRPRRRSGLRLLEHAPDMLALRANARSADVVHFQWLPVPMLDVHLLPPRRPRLLTAHDVLPREPRPGQLGATRRLLGAMDAVIVHSQHGAGRLRDEVGLPPERVHVIEHGAFEHLTRLPGERGLPPALARVEAPVVLCFGLMRPYKGIDVLIEAFDAVPGAELWVVGRPRMPLEGLRRLAETAQGRVRFVPRFVPDVELPAYFRRADVVVLPYREIDQSGVLYTALAFGKPLVLTNVGGFPEVAERGAARLVPPEDPAALAVALRELLADEPARRALGEAAARAAAGPYSWDRIAARTVALYAELVAARR